MYLGDEELTFRPEDDLDDQDHVHEHTDPSITATHTHNAMTTINGVASEPITDFNMANTAAAAAAAAAAATRKQETVGLVRSMTKQNAVK